MAFYDGWGQKLQKTGQDAVDKTKKRAEELKINAEISSLEKERQEAYAAIGKLYFERHREDAEEGMAAYFEKIVECNAKIVADQEKVAALKGGTRCKNCGKVINAGATFCPNCGARNAEEPKPVQPVKKTEPEPQPEAETVQTEEPIQAEEPVDELIPEDEPAQADAETDGSVPRCPVCGEPVEEGTVFCGNCGYKL